MYGIERSAIAEQARQIVEDNRYQDRITIIQGKVEEVDLPVPQVCCSALLGSCKGAHVEVPTSQGCHHFREFKAQHRGRSTL